MTDRNTFRSTAGFTLVELMTVVMIIGILVAIAVPIYRDARNDAADAVAAENAQIVATQVQLRLQESYNSQYRNYNAGSPQTHLSNRLEADFEDTSGSTVVSDPITNPVSGLDTVENRWGVNWAPASRRPPAVFITSGHIYEYDRAVARPEHLAGTIVVAWDENDRRIDVYWVDSDGVPSETSDSFVWVPWWE